MKSFKDYVSDAEHAHNNPIVGDLFDLELSPTEVIESEVIAIVEDGIVIAGTDSIVSLLETYSRDHSSHYDHINLHSEEEAVEEDDVPEAKYQGREVPLGRPMKGDVKKSKVYVKNPKTGKVVKVNFGDKTMKIKKSNPKRRKSFRARHNCANPGPRTKARYWSCRAW